MLGRGVVNIQVGKMSVKFEVWVAAVQDPCILGLVFLQAANCVLDLGKNSLTFPGSSTVELVTPHRSRAFTQQSQRLQNLLTPLPMFLLQLPCPQQHSLDPLCTPLPLDNHLWGEG